MALTSVAMGSDAEPWRDAGCDSYIDKTLLYNDLWHAIEVELAKQV